MCRVGFPGWKIAARLGVRLVVKIDVVHDKDASVFIATSSDLAGLVVEAKDLDELMPEDFQCRDVLLQNRLKRPPTKKPIAAWNGEFCAA